MAFVYSCCFWFSLRLGGILIGIFSILQSLLLLIFWILVYIKPEAVKNILSDCLNTWQLGYYMKTLIKTVQSDPQQIASLFMICLSFFMIITIFFIYGAYKCNIVLLIGYIVTEATRLLVLSIAIIISLLLFKQNTMDIGLLIAASVSAGFFLLGQFYLWICAVNLPIVINESKLDDQAATILKLQQLLDQNNTTRSFARGVDNLAYATTDYDTSRNNLFILSRSRLTNRNIS